MAPTDLKQKLVLATRNMNKAEELKLLLASDSLEILDLSAFPDAPAVGETSSSLRGNAKLKASSAHIYTGLWAVGDDTGLYVHALDGKPGVHSARFAGKNADSHENRSLVLDLLANKSDRTAKFVTILALAHDGQINYFEGRLNGHISWFHCLHRALDMSPSLFQMDSILALLSCSKRIKTRSVIEQKVLFCLCALLINC